MYSLHLDDDNGGMLPLTVASREEALIDIECWVPRSIRHTARLTHPDGTVETFTYENVHPRKEDTEYGPF